MEQFENLSNLYDNVSDLSQARENYQVLFHDNPVPAVIFDCDTYNIQQVNRAALSLYGYSPEEFLSLRMDQLYVPDPPFDIGRGLESLCSGDTRQIAAAHVRKDGMVIWVEGMWQRLLYGDRLSVLAWLRRVQPPRQQKITEFRSASTLSWQLRPETQPLKSSISLPGEVVFQSGIYSAVHTCRLGTQEIILMKGSHFPGCEICRNLPYQLLEIIPHISEDPDFDPTRH